MGRYKIPLDAYDMKPEGMIAYLRYNGWHFNKKMCDWAQFIKDMVDDPDQADGFIFNRFYADCNHNGIGIPWDDVL